MNQIEANRDFQSCDDACEMRRESEKLKLENDKLKRQLQQQEPEFAAKLQKSQEDLEQAPSPERKTSRSTCLESFCEW